MAETQTFDTFTAEDVRYMAEALRLAEKGLYTTHPNPRVGCVIVRDGETIGRGWHAKAGEPHAEINAIADANGDVAGAKVYVTLEPCAHQGRTPPCVNALVESAVSEVVIAMLDPNPLVDSKGVETLRSAGINVRVGLLEQEAEELNRGFVTRMRERRPWVRGKNAASLDGRTALANGASQWITSEAARRDVHLWRGRSSAILTGIGTVLADNPLMNVRVEDVTWQPLRVVVDTYLATPPEARLFSVDGEVIIATASDDEDAQEMLRKAGAQVVRMPEKNGAVNLNALMEYLVTRGVNEVFLEAGSTLSGSMLRHGLVDELIVYLAPSILGDAARGMFKLPVLDDLDQKIELDISDVRRIGPDMRILCKVKV